MNHLVRKVNTDDIAGIFALIVVLIVFSASYYLTLNTSNIVPGIDGYYYIQQIESLLIRGEFYFPTCTPVIFYFLSGLSLAFANSVVALKIGALFLHLLLSIGVLFLVRFCTNNLWLGILSIVFLNVSGLHRYLVIEYINYLGAAVFIIWGFFFTIVGLRRRKSFWFAFAVVCFTAAAGSHRSALPIILTLIVSAGSMRLLQFAFVKDGTGLRAAAWITVILLFLAPALLDAQPFFHLPFELNKEFRIFPWVPAGLSNLPEMLILLLLCPLTLLAILRWRTKEPAKIGNTVLGTVALYSILITLNPFISSQLGFLSLGGRLRTLSYIQVAILVPGIIWLLKDSHRKLVWGIPVVVIPLMIWSCFFNPLLRGAQPEYLEHRENLVNGLKSNTLQTEQNSLIIAEHGDQFVVTAITGIPSQQEFPEDNNYQAVYWLLNKIPSTLIDSSMKSIARGRDGLHTIIVKEDVLWQQRIQNPQIRGQFLKHNPHLRYHLARTDH